LAGAESVALALSVTLLVHAVRGIFNAGRRSARHRFWTFTRLAPDEREAGARLRETAERSGRSV
jgi:hypothetical protein